MTTLAKPGTIALTGAATPTSLLFSADGRSWTDISAKPFGDGSGLFAQMTAPGYFVPASHSAPRAGAAKAGSGKVGLVVVVLIVAVVAAAVGLGLTRGSGLRGGGRKGGRP